MFSHIFPGHWCGRYTKIVEKKALLLLWEQKISVKPCHALNVFQWFVLFGDGFSFMVKFFWWEPVLFPSFFFFNMTIIMASLCRVSPSWRVRWPGWPSGVMQTSPAAKGIAAGQKEWSEITDNVRGAWWALEALQCKRNINKTWPLSSDCFLQLWMALKSSPSKHCGFRTKKTILLHTVQSGKKNSNTVYKTDNETNVDSPSRMLAS